MTEHDKADEARKGLIDSAKGKAKEVIGAMTGNDSLTAESQLEHTQAQERKAANSVQAVADAEDQQAHAESTDAKVEGAKERMEVNAQTATVEGSVRAQLEAQRWAAEQDAARDVVAERNQAEVEAQQGIEQVHAEEADDVSAATPDVADTVDEHSAVEHLAANAHEQADRIRARAEQLTNDAGLS